MTGLNTPTVSRPDHFDRRSNDFVENMQFATEVDCNTGVARVDLGVLPTANATAVVVAQSIAEQLTAEPLNTEDGYEEQMGKYGRNLSVKLDGAGTPTITIHGKDYLGQPMSEDFTGNGTTAVVGKKAFKYVEAITTSAAVASRSVVIGTLTGLGLPYQALVVDKIFVDGAIGTGGTLTLAAATQTATSADPRGIFTVASGTLSDGVKDVSLEVTVALGRLHGYAHFSA